MRRFKRIMVASDLSKVSRGAFNTAIEFATPRGAELFIVHVIAPISACARAVHPARNTADD